MVQQKFYYVLVVAVDIKVIINTFRTTHTHNPGNQMCYKQVTSLVFLLLTTPQ